MCSSESQCLHRASRPQHARSRPRALQQEQPSAKGWQQRAPPFLGSLFLLGATAGPLIDGIHGQAHLLTYDRAPFELGSLHSSLWVPLLLGAFYSVLGALFALLDSLALSEDSHPPQSAAAWLSRWARTSTGAAVARASIPHALLVLGVVALLHQISSVLYSAGVPYGEIGAVLAVLAAGNWAAFDRTPQGLLLAAVCGLGAPVSELLLMKLFGLWHYDRPDVLVAGVGLPSWVAFCYFFYTPWLAAASRLLWNSLS